MVLICIFLMINDIVHLFMNLLATYRFSMEKYLFRSSAHFFNQVFLVLGCVGSLYILDVIPLLVILFAKIFSHSVGCLLLMVFFTVQSLLFLCSPSSLILFLFSLPQKTYLEKHFYSWCQRNYCLCSLIGFLWFQVSHLDL